jgi:acetyl esterase/lipase
VTEIDWNGRFDIVSPTVHHRWQGVPPGVEHLHDVPYKTVAGRTLRLELWKPEDPPDAVPTIVWLSGGAWRNINRHGPETVSAWLCELGFAVASVEYRVNSEAKFPAQIEDVKAAVRWVRAHGGEHGLAPHPVGAWGDSAGGHLAELLGSASDVKELETEGPDLDASSAVDAVCALFPPCDMRPLADRFADLFPDPPEKDRWVPLASPLDHVGPHAPPHLLVHGREDKLIAVDHSLRFQDALHAAGVECTLALLPGVGHDGRTLYGAEEVKSLVAAFFQRHLL